MGSALTNSKVVVGKLQITLSEKNIVQYMKEFCGQVIDNIVSKKHSLIYEGVRGQNHVWLKGIQEKPNESNLFFRLILRKPHLKRCQQEIIIPKVMHKILNVSLSKVQQRYVIWIFFPQLYNADSIVILSQENLTLVYELRGTKSGTRYDEKDWK